jgi:hypothetical protein
MPDAGMISRIASRVAKSYASGGGWSGSATIEFPILRWKNRFTGQLAAGDDPPSSPEDETLEQTHEEPVWVEVEIMCDVSGGGYWDPGVCSGPVESCYPPEGDFEITEFSNPAGIKWEQLTKDEQEAIEAALGEAAQEQDEPDYEPPEPYDLY